MPIDVATGSVTFDDPPLRLGPDTRRPDVAVEDLFTATLDGTAFDVLLRWDGDRLRLVGLSIAGTEDGPVELRARHDAWLEERFGRGQGWNAYAYPFGGVEHHYRWGVLGSYLIPQDYSCEIRLSYEVTGT